MTTVAKEITKISMELIALNKLPKTKRNAAIKQFNAVHHYMSNDVQRHHPMIECLSPYIFSISNGLVHNNIATTLYVVLK